SIHNRHGPAPPRTSAFNLHRKTRHKKSVRPRNSIQIRELLNLAILARDPSEVRRPDVSPVSGRAIIREHILERTIDRVRIDADHPDALFDQPQSPIAP